MTQLEALLLTLAVEVPVASLMVRGLGWTSRPSRTETWRWAVAAAAATLSTHPAAWWASVQPDTGLSIEARVAGIEALVVLAETLVLRYGVGTRWTRAFATALVMNAASLAVGLALAWSR